MKIIPQDPTRMIDLPGVGPCPRPVDIHPGVTGFTRLKSLRIYRFQPGPAIHGDSEEDEVFITCLSGRIGIEFTGPHPLTCQRGAGEALYMTPLHSYTLTPLEPCLVGYARAEAAGRVACQTMPGPAAWGLAEHLRWQLSDLGAGKVLALGGGEILAHLAEGEVEIAGTLLRAGETLALARGESGILTARGPARLLVLGA